MDQNLLHIQIRITEQRNIQATSLINIIIIILLAHSLVGPQLWPNPICKHIVSLGKDIHYFGRKTSCTIMPCQLGRGVHNFGHKSPYKNISSQLGWGVHNFGHKSPYTNISSQLGWGVHNFGHKSPYTNISSQLGWGVHNFGHKSRTQIYQGR